MERTATLFLASPVDELATNATVFVLLIISLLFLMAVAAGAEIAFFTLKAKEVNELRSAEKGTHRIAIRLLERPDLLSATLRGAKYILSIAIVVLSYFSLKLFMGVAADNYLLYFILFIAIIFILLFFGEVMPKVYARDNKLKLILFSAPIVQVLQFFLKPFINLLVDSNEYRIEKEIRQQKAETDSKEFEQTVELTLGHRASKEEIEIFQGILKFGKITAKQIMQPRMDISGISETWPYAKIRNKMLNSGYSRIPVYRQNMDTIIGMLHTRDFLPYWELEDYDWHHLIRPAYFIHEHKLIGDLLREFQQKKNHFAVVVDEFGGTSGIVTLQDIMEEIIGDIRDEFDDDHLNYQKIDSHTYVFEGKMLINSFARIVGISFDYFDEVRGDSDSLAGLLLELSGRFPTINEQINFKGFNFTILGIDKLRISKIKVVFKEEEKRSEKVAG